MIPYERHEAIMNLLREKKYVRTEQLSKALYVSVATIRRDLTEMEKNGFLQRVSGGARVIEEPKDRPVEYMVEENVRKKKHIARLASRYLRDDQRISMDAGSTVLQLCPYFERYKNTYTVYDDQANEVAVIDALVQALKKKWPLVNADAEFRENMPEYVAERIIGDVK